jgi:hypothetical protein
MIYVVEIETPNGARASKEYDAPTMRTAWRAMQRDLLRYPRFASSRFGRRADQKSGCPRWRGSGLGGASYHGRLPRTRTGEHHQVREARRRARHEHVQSIASFQDVDYGAHGEAAGSTSAANRCASTVASRLVA